MKLDATLALKSQGLAVDYTCRAQLGTVEIGGETVTFVSPLVLKGEYLFTDEEFFVRGNLKGTYTAICGRCTEPLSVELNVDFEEEFARGPSQENPDRYLFEGDIIDLQPMLDDLITLNIPQKHVCREDCNGLCPVCGINRNTTKCNCFVDEEPVETRNPFDALKALLHEENEEV